MKALLITAAVLAIITLAWGVLRVPGDAQTLTVFAASSLTDAFTDLAAAFEAAHPGTRVVLNFAGSSTLAAQISEGAPADVFASANERQMAAAQAAGHIVLPVAIFARNQLALIVPMENPANIRNLHDLARPGVLLVLAAPGVPVRAYTDALLATLASDPTYGAAYRDAVQDNIASEEVSVRQVAARIALGEADAGIVYQSDVTPDVADDVIALPIPEAVNPTAAYPIAVTQNSANAALAGDFVNFTRSSAGQSILAKWGFLPP